MNQNHPMLRDAALALPMGAGLGWLMGGSGLAAECAACALLAVLNVALLRFLTTRATEAASTGEGPGLAGSLLSVKLLLTLGGCWFLFQIVNPLAVVTGVAVALAVLAATGLADGLRTEALS